MAAKAHTAPSPARPSLPSPAGIRPNRHRVVSIIRSIQVRDEHEACFRTDARYACMEFECRWRKDCLHLVAEWFR